MWFKLYHRWNCCHTGYIATWFYISFIIHLIWISNKQYHYNHHCSSRKWQREIIICFVCCITIFIQLWSYIVVINLFYIINCLLGRNLYRFFRRNRKEGKSIFCSGGKLVPTIRMILFFGLTKVVLWVLLTIIYIISRFLFQLYDSKPTPWFQCSCRCFSCKW